MGNVANVFEEVGGPLLDRLIFFVDLQPTKECARRFDYLVTDKFWTGLESGLGKLSDKDRLHILTIEHGHYWILGAEVLLGTGIFQGFEFF